LRAYESSDIVGGLEVPWPGDERGWQYGGHPRRLPLAIEMDFHGDMLHY